MSFASVVHRWQQRTVLGDKLSMVVFFFGGIFLLWYELSYVAAYNHSGWSTGYMIHLALGVFFAINIYGNWVMMHLTEPTGKGLVFPTGPTPPGWRYCDPCVANRPPRSYHCPICNTCVLRRDHHCWFAGTCSGHENYRYFFAMSIQIVIVGLYCNIYNWSFLWSVKGEVTALNLLSFILPHVTAVMGNETWYSFFISGLTMLGFTLTCLFLWLLQIQLSQILHGQTRYERKKKIMDYDRGLWQNLREVLGHRMLLVLLCPWLPSTLPGDGLKFHSQAEKDS
ncbi:putative palmitoyltransferase ZDHHC24 [Babylonia areolata]|uniref:putative palmitoyltransferase ZDHHC24 n=1 Tax=Babylonia areolata TaxID=304850 RepID=UPI003FD047E2